MKQQTPEQIARQLLALTRGQVRQSLTATGYLNNARELEEMARKADRCASGRYMGRTASQARAEADRCRQLALSVPAALADLGALA
jgi:hypothetical protein